MSHGEYAQIVEKAVGATGPLSRRRFWTHGQQTASNHFYDLCIHSHPPFCRTCQMQGSVLRTNPCTCIAISLITRMLLGCESYAIDISGGSRGSRNDSGDAGD
jgi:hypothetical protein